MISVKKIKTDIFRKVELYIAHALNISKHEYSRIAISWVLKFLLQIALVVSGTLLVALFVDRFSIENLPKLFIFQAIAVVIGVILFSPIADKISHKKFITTGAMIAALSFAGIYFIADNFFLFFIGFVVGISIVLTQVAIVLAVFTEDLFSPLESERTFPIVESSEPLGSLAAGLLILASLQFFEVKFLLFIVATVVALMTPILLFFLRKTEKVPSLQSKAFHELKKIPKKEMLKQAFNHVKIIPFLKILAFLVFIQFVVVNILEFQFTKAVEERVVNGNSHAVETSEVHDLHEEIANDELIIDNENLKQDEKNQLTTTEEIKNNKKIQDSTLPHSIQTKVGNAQDSDESKARLKSSSVTKSNQTINTHEKHAHALTHSLGAVHILIALLLFFVQLFFSGRVMRYFGVSKTMAIHPVALLFSFIAMILNFTFFTAVASKATWEVTGALFKNAHQTSFFALREHMRAHAKEFLEGISRPLGAIVGTLIIIGLQFIFHGTTLSYVLNGILIVLSIGMFVVISYFAKHHTMLARKNLERQGDAPEKMEAIEVLAQKGHKNAAEILMKELAFRKDEPEVKVKILKTLGILKNINTLPEILKCFEDTEKNVRLAAIDALSQFENLGEQFLTQAFAKHRVVEALKLAFVGNRSNKIKIAAMRAFTKIRSSEVVPFLLQVIEARDEDIKAKGILACSLFKDPTISLYLENFLYDNSAKTSASAIVALWQFVPMRLKLLMALTKLLESKNKDELMAGIYAVGEIGLEQEKGRLLQLLKHDDEDISRDVALALGKINHDSSILYIVDFIWKKDHENAIKMRNQISNLHPEIQKKINAHLIHQAARNVHTILQEAGTDIIEELEDEVLEKLHKIFEIINAEKEALHVRSELRKRKKEKDVVEKQDANFDLRAALNL